MWLNLHHAVFYLSNKVDQILYFNFRNNNGQCKSALIYIVRSEKHDSKPLTSNFQHSFRSLIYHWSCNHWLSLVQGWNRHILIKMYRSAYLWLYSRCFFVRKEINIFYDLKKLWVASQSATYSYKENMHPLIRVKIEGYMESIYDVSVRQSRL